MIPLYALVLAASVRIGVFGLFHPSELEIRPAAGSVLEVTTGGESRVLQGSQSARLHSAARATGRGGSEASFILSVPGKIERGYRGRLEIRESSQELVAIIQMDREVAVGSIIGAEAAGVPPEAQKAQAVVARSFLTASHGRHRDFDFCDTTHCQFLREPPRAGSPGAKAAQGTHDLAIAYQGDVIAALYSADCGGHTRTLAEAGWQPERYPYFAVECPVRGNAVAGHRLGYCQKGGAEMARRGAAFREILTHFFPATELVTLR